MEVIVECIVWFGFGLKVNDMSTKLGCYNPFLPKLLDIINEV